MNHLEIVHAKTTFNVQGMDCADEVAAVDRALRSMTGVNDIQVNLVLGTVTVDRGHCEHCCDHNSPR
ncbi:MAG: heavy-metal-associated domain-containing protein [Ignavibacteria bacterium]|nr:heavy-metal-associated domain-containing protein [Ignavibacteria bacterium]